MPNSHYFPTIAFHIFEAFCQDPLPLYYIPKPYKETPTKSDQKFYWNKQNLDKTGSRDTSPAGCLGSNHLGLLGLLGHI